MTGLKSDKTEHKVVKTDGQGKTDSNVDIKVFV